MFDPVQPVPTRRDVMALLASVDTEDAELAALQAALDETLARRNALGIRRADHEAGKPIMASANDEDLIDALVRDPSCEHKPADLSTVARSYRDAVSAWERSLSLIDQAVAKIDADIASATAFIVERRAVRKELWISFVRGANDYLVEAFRDAFVRACEDFGDIVAQIEGLMDGDRNPLLNHYDHRVRIFRDRLEVLRRGVVQVKGDTRWDVEQPDGSRKNEQLYYTRNQREEEVLFPRSRKDAACADGSMPLDRFMAKLRDEAAADNIDGTATVAEEKVDG